MIVGDLMSWYQSWTMATRFFVTCLNDIVDVIVSYPIFLIGIGIFVTGAVIGLGYRLIRG